MWLTKSWSSQQADLKSHNYWDANWATYPYFDINSLPIKFGYIFKHIVIYCKPSRLQVIIAFCDDYCSANWKASFSQKLTSTLQKNAFYYFRITEFVIRFVVVDQPEVNLLTLLLTHFNAKKFIYNASFVLTMRRGVFFYRKLNFATKNNPKTPFLFKFLSKRRIIEIDLSLFNFIQP